MENFDYYNDRKWCPPCGKYVPYLMSIEHSYCTECGAEVRLFSQEDWREFNTSLSTKRPKGGRPRKQERESA